MREALKAMARGVCRVSIIPRYLIYRMECILVDPDRAFHGVSQEMSLVPGVVGEYLRREFLRLSIDRCSSDCCIGFGTVLSKRGARIGRRVYVGTRCNLGLVELGDDALLASGVEVMSGGRQHTFEDEEIPVREQGGRFERVCVGRDSWIGSGALVMADIGDKCVIGAGSVVRDPVPDGGIAVGSPARIVGRRGERTESEGA